jgi:hypothetical protein
MYRPIRHFARIRHRSSEAGRGIGPEAAERRPVYRNGCTSARRRPCNASSNRGSARAPRSGRRSSSFRDTSRARPEYFDDIQDVKITKDMLDLAKHIVETKAGHFEPAKFEDHYESALQELLETKQKGQPIAAAKKAHPVTSTT